MYSLKEPHFVKLCLATTLVEKKVYRHRRMFAFMADHTNVHSHVFRKNNTV